MEFGYDSAMHKIIADSSLDEHTSVGTSIKMSELLAKAFKVYRAVIDVATDYVSYIVFKSFEA